MPFGASARPEEILLEALVRRATVDAAFRSRLLADPVAAIQAEFGVQLPAHVRLRFMERPPDVDFLMVLPDFAGDTGELTPEQLRAAGGGLAQWFGSACGPVPLPCG